MRIRITFAKTDAMRFIGHLDLFRTWERTLRRARLPLAYSQGFHPHPKLNLASALPLGFTSSAEVLDVWLERDFTHDEVAAALEPAIPPGLQILKIETVEDPAPALQTEVEAAVYILTFLDPLPGLGAQLEELLARETLPRERRGKGYDLRPLILDVQTLLDDEAGHPRLQVRLAAREGATGRPEELILALGGEPASIRFHREKLIFRVA
jgi:radical SAM-linked protein